MEDVEIWRSAKIDAHGGDASIHAAVRADHCLEDGNLEGVAVWKRIMRAIDELQRERPADGKPVN